MRRFPMFALSLLVILAAWPVCALAQNNPRVVLDTNFGDITIELFPDAAPVTVDNFLGYVNSGFYDGLLFHRVINGGGMFIVQGGGYYIGANSTFYSRQTGPMIVNESNNGLSNVRYTIAMARTGDPDSATSQFFINHEDNLFLDYNAGTGNIGYCVFGEVVVGMDVVDALGVTPTIDWYPLNPNDPFSDIPYDPMAGIYSASVLPCDSSDCSDFSGNGGVGVEDFAIFAFYWLDNGCESGNGFCEGTDLDYSGSCDIGDFSFFSRNWRIPAE